MERILGFKSVVQSVLFCYINFLGRFLVLLLFVSQYLCPRWKHLLFYITGSLPEDAAAFPIPTCLRSFSILIQLVVLTSNYHHRIASNHRDRTSPSQSAGHGYRRIPTFMFILREGITSGEAFSLRATFRMKSSCRRASPEVLLSTGA